MAKKIVSWVEQECINHGLKMTGQRKVIAQVISESEDHPDIEEIYQRVQNIDSNVSIATVYRTVRLFEAAGIIVKHDFGDGRGRLDHGAHDHLIDLDSGEIIEFYSPEIQKIQEKIAEQYGYKLEDAKLKLYGRKIEQSSKDTKKFHIITFGCQMNVYDSSRMNEILHEQGWQEAETAEDASLVILNTCHIREKAAEKVFSEIGRLRLVRERRRQVNLDLIIAVAGCVAQAQGDEIIKRAPAVDLVFGPQSYQNLPKLLDDLAAKGRILDLDFPENDKFDSLPQKLIHKEARVQNSAAFLSIQEGCDKFCTYCVVPYTRGAEYSRPVQKIMNEALQLVKAGAQEIMLLGQNVNAWHGQGWDDKSWDLSQLIAEIAEIEGLERIRYTTSYPAEMTASLLQAHRDIEKLMPYLHLPIQSGSDPVLTKMNRRHTVNDYRRIVDKLREFRPDIALSSDFIVGFPGESDQDFENTLNLVKEIGFIQAYSFKYSPRPGTPAAEMDQQVEEKVKSERLAVLQAELNQQNLRFNENCIGKEMDVLFDRKGRKDGQIIGRSPYAQPVHIFASEQLIGQIKKVKITSALHNSLGGELVT